MCKAIIYMQVKEYHEKGAILTVCDGHGWTPLHHAARLGKVEVVQYLADHCEFCLRFVCTIVFLVRLVICCIIIIIRTSLYF